MKTKSPMPEVISDKICVLYEPSDGRIIHLHRSTILDGGKLLTDEEVESRAKRNAAAAGRQVKTVNALHIPAAAYDTSKFLVVDVREKSLRERDKQKHVSGRKL